MDGVGIEEPPSSEALMLRIADWEAELQAYHEDPKAGCSLDAFSLADFDHPADGI